MSGGNEREKRELKRKGQSCPECNAQHKPKGESAKGGEGREFHERERERG